ncbi:uncharacterized protein LOC113798403 [Dermatophagoides pteronyssinus]|uniref:uncharacterized protein LOC113798403 n=1 Tax=Dermatophagoides pteronyssinus TaxID=6956 RepID=UPI003F672475
MASAPIIIPILCLIIVAVFLILCTYRLLRNLFGCPHQKSSYLFDTINQKRKRRSVLPTTNPYTIDPSSSSSPSNGSTASPNSVYYKGGILLYPALTTTTIAGSAPSRSPSPPLIDNQQQPSKHQQQSPFSSDNNNDDDLQDEIIDLDTVDTQIGDDDNGDGRESSTFATIITDLTQSSPNSNSTTNDDTHNLLTIHSTDSSSPEHLRNSYHFNPNEDNNDDNDNNDGQHHGGGWNNNQFESDV